jgi:hypothetical protein
VKRISVISFVIFLIAANQLVSKVSPLSYAIWKDSFNEAIQNNNRHDAFINFIKLEGAYTIDQDTTGSLAAIKQQFKKASFKDGVAAADKGSLATHALFIFLDDSEKTIGAISVGVLLALNQKVPCLVSTSLLKTIFNDTPALETVFKEYNQSEEALKIEAYFKFLTENTRSISEGKQQDPQQQQIQIDRLNKDLEHKLKTMDQKKLDLRRISVTYKAKYYNLGHLRLKAMVNFNPRDWIIKFVGSSKQLCLMLPKEYKNTLNNFNLFNYVAYENPSELRLALPTDAEYATGLKIDHMEPVVDFYKEIGAYKTTNTGLVDYFLPALWNEQRASKIAKNSSDIFVSSAECSAAGKPRARWLIYMTGHGQIDYAQASISLNDFRKVLTFLETHVNTMIFAYSTCFAQGTNVELIYKEQHRSDMHKIYSYAIATEGIADKVTYSVYRIPLFNFKIDNIDFTGTSLTGLVIETDYQYAQFVAQATQQNVNFDRIFGTIMQLHYDSQEQLLTVPYYRLPGQKQFRIIDPEHHVARIDLGFAKTCASVDLEKHFTTDGIRPRYYFLDTPYIPCELILNFYPYDLPIIIPNVSKDTFLLTSDSPLYFIRKVSSTTLSLNNFINLFIRAVLSVGDFTVRVDQAEFNGGGGLFPKEGKIILTDLRINYYIKDNKRMYSVAFVHDGKVYANNISGEPVVQRPLSSLEVIKKQKDLDYKQIEKYKIKFK